MKKHKKELPQVEPVKIKPLFGMKPGLWLTIAYALALLVIVFVIAFLPDILDGSKRVTFTSAANNAAVYVDGTYIGGTPFTRKVASGTHQVSYKVNGCEIDAFQIKVGHPVFLNWLFPRTQTVASSAGLTLPAYEALTAELLEDAAAYGAILEYDRTHGYSPIFTEYAKSVVGFGFKAEELESAFQFITTDEMYQDALEAMRILGVNIAIPYSSLNGGSIGIADEIAPVLKASKTSIKSDRLTIDGFTIPAADFSNGRVTSATYPQSNEAGKAAHTESFSIGAYCVTEYQYSVFLSENPQWGLSNKENLIKEGLVDDYYLDGITISTVVFSVKPVRNVSWYAAQAFCQWMSEKTGKNVYLPTEDQWIAASLTAQESGYQKSLMPSTAENAPSAMLGSVWEMTGTPYVPMARVSTFTADSVLEAYGTPVDMVVKGGSYVNKTNIDRYSVGTTYRSLCSDYMGFRIAWN